MHPRLLIKGDRRLIFEREPARRALSSLSATDVIAVGDETISTDQIYPSIEDSGYDLTYVDVQGRRIGVDLKIMEPNSPRKNIQRRDKGPPGLRNGTHRIERWVLQKNGSVLEIAAEEGFTRYGLINVEATSRARSDDIRRDGLLDSNYVEGRAIAWRNQINELFDTLVEWCHQSDFNTFRSDNALVHEEIMQQFGVAPIQLPILKIYKGKTVLATVVPVGLWVIGAAGRLDILLATSHATIVNVSHQAAEPRWQAYLGAQQVPSDLTRETLLAILRSHD